MELLITMMYLIMIRLQLKSENHYSFRDYDENGEIDKDEFLSACIQLPPILDCFNQCLSPTGRIRPQVEELLTMNTRFCSQSLFGVWEALGKERVILFCLIVMS